MFSLILLTTGTAAGAASAVWAAALLRPFVRCGLLECVSCGEPLVAWRWRPGRRCSRCQAHDCRWPLLVMAAGACLFLLAGWMFAPQGGDCLAVTEVQPRIRDWGGLRLPFHLLLLFLLLTATVTDLLDYVIPDQITLTGTLLAILAAGISGDLQIMHIWVNWDPQIAEKPVEIYGPFLPEWMKNHQHLHGLAWSIAGMLTGGLTIWAGRIASRLILGQPAMGFGDVTLMAMVGAFLGWQPVLCALAVAPVCGMVIAGGLRILTGRTFVAFGPYLAAGAVIVLLTWRFLWVDVTLRMVFSHWPTVAGVAGSSFAAFCILLVGLRLFRAVPAGMLRK
ncbi:MAG: prepilin peptidase [Planctomycetaceae bacterium]|nr:prepilin peptidase [Planctomycetaceae bacterium]